MRLHLPAIPHTITSSEFSHCAFTGKVLRFAPMMRSRGYVVIHYGVEGSELGGVDLLSREEWEQLRMESHRELYPDREITAQNFVGDLAHVGTSLYKEFNSRLREAHIEHYREGDIVCLPFGEAHKEAIEGLNVLAVESGIGYPTCFLPFRIYESHAQKSWACGREHKSPHNYWFVCPNYYDVTEWPFGEPTRPLVGYFGRICAIKGLDIVVEVARRFPHIDFVICGQGEDTFTHQSVNLRYQPPLHGRERGVWLSQLTCLLAPSIYLEPFCGVNVEAQLCGTPVIAPESGAFVETVEQFRTGLLCHTLADYCKGVQLALDGHFDRRYVHERAQRYDMYEVAKHYDYAFKCIADLRHAGWHADTSRLDVLAAPRACTSADPSPPDAPRSAE